MTAYPTGQTRPVAANLIDLLGTTLSNAVVVEAGAGGSIDVFVSNTTDLVIDINGYYAASFGTPAAGYQFPDQNGNPLVAIQPTGNVGIGLSTPGEKLHLLDGNLLLESSNPTQERAFIIKQNGAFVGASGSSPNPQFQFGRITGTIPGVIGMSGDGDPRIRLFYSDDSVPRTERSVFEVDRKGIVASVAPQPGGHFEAYTSGTAPNPVFRLISSLKNSSPVMRLEMGDGLSPVDVAIQREGANTLGFFTGSVDTAGVERLRIDSQHIFVQGVNGTTTSSNDAVPVLIDSNGQLGTVSSSRRFKEDIQDMGEESRGLMRLRPVTFRYKRPFADGSQPIQYGLIAEEVAEVYPDLVARSSDGQIETVKYQVLNSMLLNEVQSQQKEIHFEQDQIHRLEQQISRQGQQNQVLQQRLVKLEAALERISAGLGPQ